MVGVYVLLFAFCPALPLAGEMRTDPTDGLRQAAHSYTAAQVWPSPMVGTNGLTLVENGGQWPEHARFVGLLPGSVVRVERDGIAIELREARSQTVGVLVRLTFEGACEGVIPEGLDPLPGLHSYFLGNDPARWQRGLRGHASVVWRELYPGIDVRLFSVEGRPTCEISAAPGADVGRMSLRLDGPGALNHAGDSQLTVGTSAGGFLQVTGLSWDLRNSQEAKAIARRSMSKGEAQLRVGAPAHASSLPLDMNSSLVFSTYFGGPGDEAVNGLALDASGDVYVCGATGSGLTFPMTPGTFQSPLGTKMNSFAAKFQGSTRELVYSSVFGGSGLFTQIASDIAVDTQGQATVAGITQAPDFPTTPGAYDTTKDSNVALDSGFVLRFTPSGDDLRFSTFLEGNQTGASLSTVRVDAQARSILGGWAIGPDFPTTSGAFQRDYSGSGDAIVARLSADGSRLEWSTFLGGTGADGVDRIVLEPSGDMVVAGRSSSADLPTTPGAFMESKGLAYFPLFVARLDASGAVLEWATYLAGTSWTEIDGIHSLNLDAFGGVYVSGGTNTETFPTTPGALQTKFQPGSVGATFVTRLAPDAKSLVFSTFYGGDLTGGVAPIVVDPSGVITGVGTARSDKLWPTPGAFDTTWNGDWDYHLVRFSPQGDRLFYSGFLGGPSMDDSYRIAMRPTGRLTMVGQTWFPGGFPTTPGAFQETYNGGQNDGLITTLELYLSGVQPFGTSKPSCLGPLTMNVTEMPAPDATRFAFWCSAAPPNAVGWLVVQPAADAPMPSAFVPPALRMPVQSDAAGYVETRFPLTGFVAGDRFLARYVFLNAPSCPPNAPVASSNGLEITVTSLP